MLANVMAQDIYLTGLNPEQLQAATHVNGPLLILAGAGTGKTKVLTARIINLIHKGHAQGYQILAVTFTNKAAKEMLHRVGQYISTEGLYLNTFHSIAAKILRKYSSYFNLSTNFTILGAEDQLRLIKNILQEHNIDDKKFQPKIILSIIQRWKDHALKPENLSSSDLLNNSHVIAKKIYEYYQQKLKFLDAVDFGDLLLYNIDLFTKNPEILSIYHNKFKYILVDEYQDTNIAQYIWLRLLTNDDQNICCVGDEDQSIYGWRGAEIGNILRFEKDFKNANIIRLEQNYRSTNNILLAASNLISNNNKRLGKKLWSESGQGEKIKIVTLKDSSSEANFITKSIYELYNQGKAQLQNIAILVRAGFQTRSFEETMLNYNIPYTIIGGLKFYDRQEIKDVLAYIRASVNPGDSLALERIINLPKRGIGPTTFSQIEEYAIENNIAAQFAMEEMLSKNLFKPKLANTITEFLLNLQKWRQSFKNNSMQITIESILHESGYIGMWENDKSLESQGRIENIKEFLQALQGFNNINDFLEHVSLVAENNATNSSGSLNIMTIHAAKGLEFDIVFLPGLEEGIFPHQRNLDEEESKGLEEERRLAYVAITRAKKELIITNTVCRNIFGKWQTSIPSRFISELPQENIYCIDKSYNLSAHHNISNYQSRKSNIFKIGSRVKHDKFGHGYILQINDNQFEISFDNIGTKRVLDSFVSLA